MAGVGYAHYIDAQYPQAIAAFQKAQPQIGELSDYIAFYVGNSYVLSNHPEESWRTFAISKGVSRIRSTGMMRRSRTPRRLLATNRPTEAIRLLDAHRAPHRAETEYYLGKAYVQNGQARMGAEILQRVYYNYATNYLADQAPTDLKKMPEAASLPSASYTQHLKRAEALYKAHRYKDAIGDYQNVADFGPPAQHGRVDPAR